MQKTPAWIVLIIVLKNYQSFYLLFYDYSFVKGSGRHDIYCQNWRFKQIHPQHFIGHSTKLYVTLYMSWYEESHTRQSYWSYSVILKLFPFKLEKNVNLTEKHNSHILIDLFQANWLNLWLHLENILSVSRLQVPQYYSTFFKLPDSFMR